MLPLAQQGVCYRSRKGAEPLDKRNRWIKSVTPSGIESTPSVTKLREASSSPTENRGTRSSKRRVVTLSGSKVAKIAAIARNALGNYDLTRAIELLEELRGLGEGRSR